MNKLKKKNVLKRLKKSTALKDYLILSNRGKVIKIYKKMRLEKFVHVVREILYGGYKPCILIQNEKKVYIKKIFVQNNIAVIIDYKNNVHYFDGQTIKELSKLFEFSKNSIKLRIKYFEVVKNIFNLSEKFGDILSVFKFKRKVIPSLGANGFCVVNFISLFSCKIL